MLVNGTCTLGGCESMLIKNVFGSWLGSLDLASHNHQVMAVSAPPSNLLTPEIFTYFYTRLGYIDN